MDSTPSYLKGRGATYQSRSLNFKEAIGPTPLSDTVFLFRVSMLLGRKLGLAMELGNWAGDGRE